MYVSTAKVLRQFAQKMASASPKLDALEKVELEPKSPKPKQGPQEAPRTGFAGKSTDPYVSAVEDSTRKPSMLHSALSGVDSAVNAGKSLGNMAKVDWQQNVNPYTVGLGGAGGAALMYAIAKMRQSEEDRKKGKQPILAPALGLAGGAALTPLLAGLMTRLGTRYAGPPQSANDMASLNPAVTNQAPEGHAAGVPGATLG